MGVEEPITECVTFGAQVEGSDAHSIVREPHALLRSLLRKHTIKRYSSEISELALVLRVDGALGGWNKVGCDKLRLQRTGGYATIDILVPVPIWRDLPSWELGGYMARYSREGIVLMLERIERAKVVFESERLLSDVDAALDEFARSITHAGL